MCTAGLLAMQHPHIVPCHSWSGHHQELWHAVPSCPCPAPLLRVGMDAGLLRMGLPHAIPSPCGKVPNEQVEGFLPLPITLISPVN